MIEAVLAYLVPILVFSVIFIGITMGIRDNERDGIDKGSWELYNALLLFLIILIVVTFVIITINIW